MNGSRDKFTTQRERMVDEQIRARGVTDPLVLAAMRQVPRHLFVPLESIDEAYEDHPVILEEEQSTISQPYIVAYMTEALHLTGDERVLEVGTGSGYQAAILASICQEVYTVERYPSLSQTAAERLQALGYRNVMVRTGDGCRGLLEFAPFDAIMVTAAGNEVPPELQQQLAVGGRLIMPVGDARSQNLVRITRAPGDHFERDLLIPCVFVPLVSLESKSDA
jgi:protein-L-isoaspartate(D-aspartate) O-methyltransferase